MDGGKGVFDSFRVEEAYSWRDDIMGITRRIVHETDEARLNNIAEHFEVDLSEIREFLKMKQRQKRKPITNYDRLVSKSPEDLAAYYFTEFFKKVPYCHENCPAHDDCQLCLLDWLKEEVK